MNISKFRNSYLIDKAYRLTLVSVTLTALAPLIATLVDGLFSSRRPLCNLPLHVHHECNNYSME